MQRYVYVRWAHSWQVSFIMREDAQGERDIQFTVKFYY